MLSTFSRSVLSKVYEACIFLIGFLVSCIILHLTGWNLIPHFLAQEPNHSILLKFHCVFFILNFMIANTVISKKFYFRLNIWWVVIYVRREQQGTKNGALAGTRQNRSPVRVYSIYNNLLFSDLKKRIYPFQCPATNSTAKQFAFKEFMRGCIKCFFQNPVSICPLLSKILAQLFITVVNWVSQLCPFLNACCLSDRSLYSSRWAMIFEHTMCSSNLQGTQVRETGR